MTTYFQADQIHSLSDLKARYRILALEHHPDRGGTDEAMKLVNLEFDHLFSIWNKSSDFVGHTASASQSAARESASAFREDFYQEQGWRGSNVDGRYRTAADLNKIFRAWLKETFPACRFSVRASSESYQTPSLNINLMEAPFEVFNRPGDVRRPVEIRGGYGADLTPEGAKLFRVLEEFVVSYRYDYSDPRVDHFNTNFYYHLGVGDYKRPFKVVAREEKFKPRRSVQRMA